MKLTKQLIARFSQPDDISVRLFNGYFKKAEAKVVYANGWEYRIEVDTTPEELKQFGDFNEAKFLWPSGKHSWMKHPVPDKLKFVEDNLRYLSRYTEEEIVELEAKMSGALTALYRDMCWEEEDES